METTLNESTLRSQAKRLGYRVSKSRQAPSLNNLVGYQIVDANRNWVVAGGRWEMILEDVAAFLNRQE